MKVILFDADGVIINKPKLFSDLFSEKYNIPLQKIERFFIKDWPDCLIGKADTKERLKPYLKEWGWQGSVEELLELWFKSEAYTDQRLVNSINEL